MIAEDHIFKVIKDQFRRSVFVRLYFIDNHLCLFFDFVLRKGGMENDIRQQFQCSSEVLGQKCRIDHSFLFIGIRIQIATHILHAVQDMPSLPFPGTFKNKMLYKVSHSLFIFGLITGSGIYGKSAISHLRRRGFMNNAKSIGQGMYIILHFCTGT